MSDSAFVENAAPTAATPKTDIPIAIHCLRPKRSPMVPPSRSSPASTRVYESITHWSVDVDAPRSRDIAGRAVLTIVLSTKMRKIPSDITARTSHRVGLVLICSAECGIAANAGICDSLVLVFCN